MKKVKVLKKSFLAKNLKKKILYPIKNKEVKHC